MCKVRINACGDSRLRGLRSRKPIGFRQWVVHQTVKELAEVGIECEPIRVDAYTGKKKTFFQDPDGLPLELHE